MLILNEIQPQKKKKKKMKMFEINESKRQIETHGQVLILDFLRKCTIQLELLFFLFFSAHFIVSFIYAAISRRGFPISIFL